MQQQLLVIGGGAAGFFCAVNAARMNPQLKVTIVEKSNKVLSKVKVSGGGRCNVTHACFEISELVKKYPRGQNFLKKAFYSFNTTHTVQWFEERNVVLKTEEDGRMFPSSNSSETIIHCLLAEADKYKVEVKLQTEIQSIFPKDGSFEVHLSNGTNLNPQFICIACGGYPKASQFGWLQNLQHSFENPVPSLFTFNMPKHPITELMGVSVGNAQVKIMGSKLQSEGPLLITHWGLSGPAVLKLSAWGARELANNNYQFEVQVNWLPQFNENTLREEWQFLRQQIAAQKVFNKNPFGLPNRLWNFLAITSGILEDARCADVATKQQNVFIKNLTAQVFEVNGKTTFKEEFVTCGGIKLSEINPTSMQSKLVPRLYFAGEIMDIDGITGGFNFQNAWTSGWIAAQNIAQASL